MSGIKASDVFKHKTDPSAEDPEQTRHHIYDMTPETDHAARICPEDLTWLYDRPRHGHKGTFGKVLVAAGSEEMCGAAFFCASAVLHTGAGMVRILSVPENRIPLQTLLPEAMVDCSPDRENSPPPSWELDLDWCDVLVLGPGLGTDKRAARKMQTLIQGAVQRDLPLVLDADGLNLLAAHPAWQKSLPRRTILTPHMGEMSRLTGFSIPVLSADKAKAASTLAARLGCVCVLKDAVTVIADAQGRVYINTTGNDGMGTAGSGDVLAGILGGLLAQRLRIGLDSEALLQTAACGVYLHGFSGDLAAEAAGSNYITAGDICRGLSLSEKKLRQALGLAKEKKNMMEEYAADQFWNADLNELSKPHTRVCARIDLNAVRANFEAMKQRLRPGVKVAAVVKADAYGHGAIPIARLVEPWDYIWGFCTATAEEALTLRKNGITKPILIIGLVFEDDLKELALADVRITVCSYTQAQAYAEAGRMTGRRVKVHLAVDTGMSRIGFADKPESLSEICRIGAIDNLEIEGIFTHFARADERSLEPAYQQLSRFNDFVQLIGQTGLSIPIHHASNSAGILRLPEANLDMVRAGITIYGIYPSDEVERETPMTPVMELKSHISFVKIIPAGTAVSYGGTYTAPDERRLATIPVGYADGYPRQLSGKGWVLIHQKAAPICGRVCMDQFMVDVTDIPEAGIGDEVTLMGRDGSAFLGVDTLGALSGRFPYEFVCDISPRVPRVYRLDKR